MAEISELSLVLIIQAVDREITRLISLPDEAITPAEDVQLVKYESLTDELEEAYAIATKGQTNLPDYERLVTDRGQDLDDDGCLQSATRGCALAGTWRMTTNGGRNWVFQGR